MKLLKFTGLIILFFFQLIGSAQTTTENQYVDDIEAARALLQQERNAVLQNLNTEISPAGIQRLIALGALKQAHRYISQADTTQIGIQLAQARLNIKKHAYFRAEDKVKAVLSEAPNNAEALFLRAKLYLQSWELNKTKEIAQKLLALEENYRTGYLLGKVALFRKDYSTALKWAKKAQKWNPDAALGYVLEAEVLFWSRDADAAEQALVQALIRDPFNADARFNYGYAIWRRVDATQLDEMADQWNFALEINPLHYRTHWHFGNGHTDLTYADYAIPNDSIVHNKMTKVDELVAGGNLREAIALTRKIEADFPNSVIPEMVRGSIFYMNYKMDREIRLDSAQHIFKRILQEKQNYGPAHNGLAAVIKQRQFSYLHGFDKLEAAIKNTTLPKNKVFYEVFPDLNYYPGERVAKMVTQQIGPSRAYLPMINALGLDFQIPPLHHNLAEAMGNRYFLYGTTFDNRQWMDIRGVGSGATGIEYIERGSHWERNVLAHEYAHLYHGRILTNKESRRIRALYHQAMRHDRTLDYYSANNESEFFAQAYAAYLSDKKVHPLTHKSMNTRAYLRKKDPALYAFVDSLVKKQKAYLSGNKLVFNSNWAQTYVTRSHRKKPQLAKAYLDTALQYDPNYIPALLAYADIEAKQGKIENAKAYIQQAKDVNLDYAPISIVEANVLHQMALQGKLGFRTSFERQLPLFELALQREKDLGVRAQMNRTYRNRALQYGKVAMALEIGKKYLKNPPLISTYLRDRTEETHVFVKSLQSDLGYSEDQIPFFRELIAQNPQNFSYRLNYADVLLHAHQPEKALRVLKTGQRMLRAANNQRPGYLLRIAELMIGKEGKLATKKKLAQLNPASLSFAQQLYLGRLYLQVGAIDKAEEVLPDRTEIMPPYDEANWAYSKALIEWEKGNPEIAEGFFRLALEKNPYQMKARQEFIHFLQETDQRETAFKISEQAKNLIIAPGPDFQF